MNRYYKGILLGLTLSGSMLMTGCQDEDYVEANTNPDVLSEVAPENQFFSAALSLQSNDFETFYDSYRRIMPWMQYVTPQGGNALGFTSNIDNFSKRYDRLYIGVGNALVDLEKRVEGLPLEEQARYEHMVNIARLLKAYYAFYVSDIYGDIVYTEGWQGRYGGTLQPVYDEQQSLFKKLDGEMEAAIAVLKATPSVPQIPLGNFDPYYAGNALSWVRAGNAVRLRLAMRLLKNDATTAQGIIQEVLAEPADNLMADNEQGWVFKGTSGFTAGVNWNPDLIYAGKPLVDFLVAQKDPRLDALVAPNSYSKSRIDSLIKKGQLKPTAKEGVRYVGSFTSPDESRAAVNKKYYTRRPAVINGQTLSLDTLSLIQRRLFQPSFDEGNGPGTGAVYQPILTYAEFCFMRAELAARNITEEDAEDLYTKGVTASIEWYNKIATEGGLSNYTAVTAQELSKYLDTTAVAFDPARALDQIASQSYINFFKQPAEAWALWKRTGLPNASTVLELPPLISNGGALRVPRRAPLPLLNEISPNYKNQQAAYDRMLASPSFGSDPNDVFGRVWWDQ